VDHARLLDVPLMVPTESCVSGPAARRIPVGALGPGGGGTSAKPSSRRVDPTREWGNSLRKCGGLLGVGLSIRSPFYFQAQHGKDIPGPGMRESAMFEHDWDEDHCDDWGGDWEDSHDDGHYDDSHYDDYEDHEDYDDESGCDY
jgi:hypothetical protein